MSRTPPLHIVGWKVTLFKVELDFPISTLEVTIIAQTDKTSVSVYVYSDAMGSICFSPFGIAVSFPSSSACNREEFTSVFIEMKDSFDSSCMRYCTLSE